MGAYDLTALCHRCGGAAAGTYETVPYLGPGPRAVELRDVHILRCTACANMLIEVPEPARLDTLIRCLATELQGQLPQLAFEQGRWCILPRLATA